MATGKVRVCSNCGTYNPLALWNCQMCGATLSETTIQDVKEFSRSSIKYCPRCNCENVDFARFCQNCGFSLLKVDIYRKDVTIQPVTKTESEIDTQPSDIITGKCYRCGNPASKICPVDHVYFCSNHGYGKYCKSCYEKARMYTPIGIQIVSWLLYIIGILIFGAGVIAIILGISGLTRGIQMVSEIPGIEIILPILFQLPIKDWGGQLIAILCVYLSVIIGIPLLLNRLGKSLGEGSDIAKWIIIILAAIIVYLGKEQGLIPAGILVALIVYNWRWFEIRKAWLNAS